MTTPTPTTHNPDHTDFINAAAAHCAMLTGNEIPTSDRVEFDESITYLLEHDVDREVILDDLTMYLSLPGVVRAPLEDLSCYDEDEPPSYWEQIVRDARDAPPFWQQFASDGLAVVGVLAFLLALAGIMVVFS